MVRSELPTTGSVTRPRSSGLRHWLAALGWRLLYVPLGLTYRFWPFSCLIWVLLLVAIIAVVVHFVFGVLPVHRPA